MYTNITSATCTSLLTFIPVAVSNFTLCTLPCYRESIIQIDSILRSRVVISNPQIWFSDLLGNSLYFCLAGGFISLSDYSKPLLFFWIFQAHSHQPKPWEATWLRGKNQAFVVHNVEFVDCVASGKHRLKTSYAVFFLFFVKRESYCLPGRATISNR